MITRYCARTISHRTLYGLRQRWVSHGSVKCLVSWVNWAVAGYVMKNVVNYNSSSFHHLDAVPQCEVNSTILSSLMSSPSLPHHQPVWTWNPSEGSTSCIPPPAHHYPFCRLCLVTHAKGSISIYWLYFTTGGGGGVSSPGISILHLLSWC